eukprot:355877-Chlamydomonas_euryale.AAC.2
MWRSTKCVGVCTPKSTVSEPDMASTTAVGHSAGCSASVRPRQRHSSGRSRTTSSRRLGMEPSTSPAYSAEAYWARVG